MFQNNSASVALKIKAMSEKERIQSLRAELVDWLGEKFRASGAMGLVFGMSGGVDSNLTALLAKEVAGDKHLGVILPIDNDPQEQNDAERLALEHRINIQSVDLSGAYSGMIQLLPESDDLTKANFKLRLRMSILYYFANVRESLVIGTINKVEYTIGYFAKYSYGDLMPLANLLKRDIRALAIEMGMSEDLANKKASGCITGVRNAEDEWGISEEELDEIIANWNNPEVLERDSRFPQLKRLYNLAEHKRRYPPVFIPNLK